MRNITSILGFLWDKVICVDRHSGPQDESFNGLRPRSLYAVELAYQKRKVIEDQRRRCLSDSDLRLELQRHYGATKWSKRMIDEMLSARTA